MPPKGSVPRRSLAAEPARLSAEVPPVTFHFLIERLTKVVFDSADEH